MKSSISSSYSSSLYLDSLRLFCLRGGGSRIFLGSFLIFLPLFMVWALPVGLNGSYWAVVFLLLLVLVEREYGGELLGLMSFSILSFSCLVRVEFIPRACSLLWGYFLFLKPNKALELSSGLIFFDLSFLGVIFSVLDLGSLPLLSPPVLRGS